MVSNYALMKIAVAGGVIVSATGFVLQQKLISQIQNYDYYRNALKILRQHRPAVTLLGEPIKDKKFRIYDTENNFFDEKSARFKIPVSGSLDKGTYYFWARKSNGEWEIIRAELELNSHPGERLALVKGKDM